MLGSIKAVHRNKVGRFHRRIPSMGSTCGPSFELIRGCSSEMISQTEVGGADF